MRLGERLGFDIFLVLLFLRAAIASLGFEPAARVLPLSVSAVGAAMMLAQASLDLRTQPAASKAFDGGRVETSESARGDKGSADKVAAESVTGWYGPLRSFVWLSGFVFLIWLIGYLIATPIFSLVYMRTVGRIRWTTALGATAAIWVCMYLLLRVVLHM